MYILHVILHYVPSQMSCLISQIIFITNIYPIYYLADISTTGCHLETQRRSPRVRVHFVVRGLGHYTHACFTGNGSPEHAQCATSGIPEYPKGEQKYVVHILLFGKIIITGVK